MSPRRSCSHLPTLLVCLLLALSAHAAEVTLDSSGGDAWTFDKTISGRADAACEQVRLRSESAAVNAWLEAGRFEAQMPLQGGGNVIRAECLAEHRVLDRSPAQRWQVRLPDAPKAWVRLRTRDDAVWLDAGRSVSAPGTHAPLTRFEWQARPGNPAPLVPHGGTDTLTEHSARSEELQLEVPQRDGEYYVELRVTDAHGRQDTSTAVFRVENGRALEVDPESEHPAWVDRAVLYGAAPFFFGDGRVEDIAERLDHIAALGATVIWLSPLTDAPADDFGYAVRNHFKLRESFATPEEFRAFVQSAHARGLRVIMDFVPSHFAEGHPYHLHAERHGKRSPYYDWFERDAHGEIHYYFDWENLKSLDYDHPEVQNHIIAAGRYWIEEFDIDGYRVDASWAVANRAPEFWPRWREELKRIKPDIFLLAEASAREPYHVANGFDAAYDWSGQLGQWAWEAAFPEDGPIDVGHLRRAISNGNLGYPEDTLILRFLNNNDTGERFISRYDPAHKKLAAALTFTLPGLPLIYNGDEVGAEFEPYDEGPAIDWSHDPHGLENFYRRLSELREETPALLGREIRFLETDQRRQALAFVRPGKTSAQDVLVVFNFGSKPLSVQITETPVALQGELEITALAGERPRAAGRKSRLTLDLAPQSAAIVQPSERSRR